MYSHILLPTDGSDCADAALDHAIEHARTYSATFVVLYVADVREIGYATPALSLGQVCEALLESGEQVLDHVAQAAREAGVEAETVVMEGTPASEIIRHANEREVDLVVMGAHGRSGVDRYPIGNVAKHVARGSDAPALTVWQESS